ncbi:hypothetical protein [Inquilinus sp. OTU3971]|uniref:hypothetical protein n=1 Tax=Inquilinus sp. OTU3971 TaxID=3043855 RepID=UPI00313BC561
MAVIVPSEGDPTVRQADQTRPADGEATGVAAAVGQSRRDDEAVPWLASRSVSADFQRLGRLPDCAVSTGQSSGFRTREPLPDRSAVGSPESPGLAERLRKQSIVEVRGELI